MVESLPPDLRGDMSETLTIQTRQRVEGMQLLQISLSLAARFLLRGDQTDHSRGKLIQCNRAPSSAQARSKKSRSCSLRTAVFVLWPISAALLGCASTRSADPPESSGAPDAPWSAGRLSAASVPEAYLTEWSLAENRSTCDLIAFTESAATQGATPRAATFSGGWGIAYDQPGLRSAFGVAGTGVKASEATYSEWPHRLAWSDGSSVGYGPEGGTGPNQLAYLTISGQECLYNVWSRVSRAHLEELIHTLRFVETGG